MCSAISMKYKKSLRSFVNFVKSYLINIAKQLTETIQRYDFVNNVIKHLFHFYCEFV